jgi:hypothetical protein
MFGWGLTLFSTIALAYVAWRAATISLVSRWIPKHWFWTGFAVT